jgi:hypothetical protein
MMALAGASIETDMFPPLRHDVAEFTEFGIVVARRLHRLHGIGLIEPDQAPRTVAE